MKQPRKPKILIYDLEFCATQTFKGDLRIDPGFIFCFGYKELGSPRAKTISILDYPGRTSIDDSNLVREIGKILQDVDLHVFQFGKRCDFKFIQTKLLKHGFPLLSNKYTAFDTCEYARRYLGLKSNSLAALATFFNLDESKMHLPADTWLLANAGNELAIRRIARRCESDVRITEEIYLRLRPLVTDHPPIHSISTLEELGVAERPKLCQCCGEVGSFSAQGPRPLKTKIMQQWKCRRCGAWVSTELKVPKPEKVKKAA